MSLATTGAQGGEQREDPGATPPPGTRPPADDEERMSGTRDGRGATPGPGRRGIADGVASALVAASAGVAGCGFQRVFALGDLLPVVAVAAVAPVLLAVLTRRRPLWLSLLVQLVVWPLTVSATLFRADAVAGFLPSARTLAGITGGLLDSWRALLTTILPAPAEPRLLVFVHFLVWFAALAGAELVLRSRRRARVLPALPALVVFALAVPLGVDGPGSDMAVAAVLLGLVAALMVVGGDRGGVVRMLAGVPVAVVLGLAALLVAPLLPVAREPYDPRSLVEQPQVARFDSVSPLDRVSAWLQMPTTPLFTVKAARPEYWRLAVLDTYDGVRWSSSSRFQTTGGRVPSGPYRGAYEVLDQTVTLQGLPGTWLPAADRPVAVSGMGVAVDRSGALIATARGATGATYDVTSWVPRPSTAQRREAVAVGPAPPLPPDIAVFRSLAERMTRNARSPYQQATLLEHYLRTREKYDVTSPPGHSLAALEYFLRTTHRGTSEQFASSFALLARTLGLRSRVVVGFRPGTPRDGVFQVLSGDVLAWPEIEFKDLGWVAFDPTPERSGSQARQDVVSTAVKEREQLAQQIGGTAKQPRPSPTPTPETGDDAARPSGPPVAVLAAGGAAGAVLAYVLAVVIAPVLRRRRRRRGEVGERVLGAWRQVCEDLGLDGEVSLTASEVSQRAVERVGPEISADIGALAELSNYVEFAGRSVGSDAADEAWRRADAVARRVWRTTPLLARVAGRLHPRSLRPARPPRRSTSGR
ncbi:transglutaminase family protein [Sphaerisporangium fuscum]|uniref:transglutaminase family protein n=1 Tax=Sphaerisporangium fuscum TaxID=2835868 RepID=UPI001BDC0658|nr:DUF3488 and transglutaminase-like domain-containing protein [Sphaerisporangium fuscum]